jgi:hypothetical protein
MEPYTMVFRLDRDQVRLALMREDDELLRARLPPPCQFWTGKSAKALLESLAIWLDAQLRAVFDAADPADGFSLELTDEAGTGLHTLFYDVVPIERRRRRPSRLRGVGDFRDVHALCLLGRLSGGGR